MAVDNDLPTGRRGFREPISAIAHAALILDQAANAHIAGQHGQAGDLIRAANVPELREWLESVWGKSPYIHYRSVPDQPVFVAVADRGNRRMPTTAEKKQVVERDGHHCRLCGIPVIRPEVRTALHCAYPEALPWGRTNNDQHAAFQVMWLQYDHVVPHARGGTNEQANLIVACAACNFGRMNYTLAEVGFAPLGDLEVIRSGWDGLERVMSVEARWA